MKNQARKTAAIAALCATTTFSLFTPAFAHDQLVSVTPESGTTLTATPDEIVMEFSGDIMNVDGANQIKVVDAEGNSLADGAPKIDGKTVTQKLTKDESTNDTYTITWRVVSSDGHAIQDSFEYTVGNGATSSAASSSVTEAGSADATDQDSHKSGFTPANIAIFAAAAVLVIGAVAVVATKARRR